MISCDASNKLERCSHGLCTLAGARDLPSMDVSTHSCQSRAATKTSFHGLGVNAIAVVVSTIPTTSSISASR